MIFQGPMVVCTHLDDGYRHLAGVGRVYMMKNLSPKEIFARIKPI